MSKWWKAEEPTVAQYVSETVRYLDSDERSRLVISAIKEANEILFKSKKLKSHNEEE